jgi:hydrocephalus-inducing protein
VLRPWCHFELPESDYISGGRRAPDMPGPSGALGPLDPATRVLELASLGVKVKNSLSFAVLNPTGVAYEFHWEHVGPPAAAGGPGMMRRTAPFVCTTKSGAITGM